MIIKDVRQWLLWIYDNGQKRPTNKWGDFSGSTYTNDYMTFDEATEADASLQTIGTAFCFTEDDAFVGIDLDDCMVDECTPKDWVVPILDRFSGTYAEVSPSLTGIKVIFQGEMPKQMTHQVGVENGSIEVYESGRFFTFTGMQWGDSNEVTNQQDAIDWLFLEYWPSVPVRVAISTNGNARSAFGTLDRRAQDYILACEKPLPGGRNNQAFSIAKNLREIIHDGEILSDDRVLEHVQAWNVSLPEPLDDSEIQRTVASACAKPPKYQLKPELVRDDYSDVDLSGILAEPSESIEPLPRPEGLLADIIDHMESIAIRPQPELSMAAAIATMCVLLGRRVCDELGNRTNLYLLGIVETGRGKENGRAVAKSLLLDAGHESIIDEVASDSGILETLQHSPNAVWMCDEFGKFMAAISSQNANSHEKRIVDLLLKLYSQAGQRYTKCYADPKYNRQVEKPCLSVYGTTTPGVLFDALTSASTKDGFLPRLLAFRGDDKAPRQGSHGISQKIPEVIVRDAMSLLLFEPEQAGNLSDISDFLPHVINRSPEAAAAYEVFADWCDDQDSLMWTRTAENACRLSIIHACSRARSVLDAVIEARDFEWAESLCRRQTLTFGAMCGEMISDSRSEDLIKQAIEVVTKAGGKISKSDFYRRTRRFSKRERVDAVEHLAIEGILEFEEMGNLMGRPGTFYVLRK